MGRRDGMTYARFETSPIEVDPQGYARIDGVCIGRLVRRHPVQGTVLQVKDRNRRRCQARGREFVYVSLTQIQQMLVEAQK